MKKYFFVVLAIVNGYATSCARIKTPKEVVTAFNFTYSIDNKVKLDKVDNNSEAGFKLNKVANQKFDVLETKAQINFIKLHKNGLLKYITNKF